MALITATLTHQNGNLVQLNGAGFVSAESVLAIDGTFYEARRIADDWFEIEPLGSSAAREPPTDEQ